MATFTGGVSQVTFSGTQTASQLIFANTGPFVPEPGTWAFLLGGLGLLALGQLRRTRRS